MEKKSSLPFYILVIAIFLILIAPNMFSDGMFMDGLFYATIAENLANGMSSFWHPTLTASMDTEFYSHPPLMFGLESLFFRIFGSGYLSERIYSFSTFVVTGIIVVKIWKNIQPDISIKTGWLPLLFWFSIPLISWTITNNMLENTMMVFTSLSILFLLKSFQSRRFLWIPLAGLSLLLAFMIKGLTGLFPLMFLFWGFLFLPGYSFKRMIVDTSLLVFSFTVGISLMFWIWPDSYTYLQLYFEKQLVTSLTAVQDVDSRFFIVFRLFKELIPSFILLLVGFLLFRKNRIKNPSLQWISIFLCLGLSGVLPVMISLKQSGFYILATFPFFAIVFALLLHPSVSKWYKEKYANNWILNGIAVFLLLFGLGMNVYFSTTVSRDKEKIELVQELNKIKPEIQSVSASGAVFQDWSLQAYLWRKGKISMTTVSSESEFILLDENQEDSEYEEYTEVPISSTYRLLKR